MWHVISSLCIWGGERRTEINEQMTKWMAELIKHHFIFCQLVTASVPTTSQCHVTNLPHIRDGHSAFSRVNFIPKEGTAKTRPTPSIFRCDIRVKSVAIPLPEVMNDEQILPCGSIHGAGKCDSCGLCSRCLRSMCPWEVSSSKGKMETDIYVVLETAQRTPEQSRML